MVEEGACELDTIGRAPWGRKRKYRGQGERRGLTGRRAQFQHNLKSSLMSFI